MNNCKDAKDFYLDEYENERSCIKVMCIATVVTTKPICIIMDG